MYCRKCGNEILKTDKYCFNCGHSVALSEIESKTLDKEKLDKLINVLETENNSTKKTKMTKQESKNLPMNWWNFWKYIRFPLGLVVSFGTIAQYSYIEFDGYTACIFVFNILIVLLSIFTYYSFLDKKKYSYTLFIINLFVETVWNGVFTTCNNLLDDYLQNYKSFEISDFMIDFLLILLILGIVWIVPNYIYFKKRENFFYDK